MRTALIWLCLAPVCAGAAVFDVKAYGARGDGHIEDRGAIMKAIEAATGVNGGTVLFPAGTYLTGSIRLRSNIQIQFEAGAVLIAVADRTAYEDPEANPSEKYQGFGSSHWHNGLLWGDGLENITISGPGLIDGRGLRTDDGDSGDKVVALRQCRNVTLRDFSILRGGHYAVLLSGNNNVTIDNLRIDTNRDGINLDSSQNVRISNVTVNAPMGRAIALNSSLSLGVRIATKDVSISNSLVSGYDEGSVVAGVASGRADPGAQAAGVTIGASSFGDFQNIVISNVVFERTRGLEVTSADGSSIEGIAVSNLAMRDVRGAAIAVLQTVGESGGKGLIRGISIDNVIAYGTGSGISIDGANGRDIEDVRISGFHMVADRPEPNAFGMQISGASGVEINGADIRIAGASAPFRLARVKRSGFHYVGAAAASPGRTFLMDNVEDITIDHCGPLADTVIAKATHREI